MHCAATCPASFHRPLSHLFVPLYLFKSRSAVLVILTVILYVLLAFFSCAFVIYLWLYAFFHSSYIGRPPCSCQGWKAYSVVKFFLAVIICHLKGCPLPHCWNLDISSPPGPWGQGRPSGYDRYLVCGEFDCFSCLKCE